ncbi:hypothetical protein PLUTE_a2845 [Pseudoalteromonas luteoviolacea DSM 6061]|nr:hypothetical protein [Pseudoalteromonas luteoviolacea DSM 6061]
MVNNQLVVFFGGLGMSHEGACVSKLAPRWWGLFDKKLIRVAIY